MHEGYLRAMTDPGLEPLGQTVAYCRINKSNTNVEGQGQPFQPKWVIGEGQVDLERPRWTHRSLHHQPEMATAAPY